MFVDGVCARKPSAPVPGGAHVDVRGADDYVSRGAYKLLGAFSAFAPHGLRPPEGLDWLAIGASTGGVCAVLLRDGALRVIALDVGHGQLDARIASDPRIIEMSGVNIREVDPTDLPFAPDGSVFVDGVCARKPSAPVPGGAHVDVRGADDYVSRGAYKLLGAFSAYAPNGLLPPEGLDCLDIGATTGGFCDVLLRDGAHRVIALDVGHGQLDARIAADPRTTEMSGVNIRDVDPTDLPFAPQTRSMWAMGSSMRASPPTRAPRR